jgi:hypothetical protein
MPRLGGKSVVAWTSLVVGPIRQKICFLAISSLRTHAKVTRAIVHRPLVVRSDGQSAMSHPYAWSATNS